MFEIDLTERVAAVIGGSRGIGAAICRTLAEAGAKIAWTNTGSEAGVAGSKELAAQIDDIGVECLNAVVQCTDPRATEAFIAHIVACWGRLDYLVYNAGFTSPVPFAELTVEEWRRVVDINLNGAFIATRAALPQMENQDAGAIVLIGSAAIVSGGGGRADYVSAKAGLEGLNRAITKEYAPAGIRCNIVHPSLIETDLLKQRYPDPADRTRAAGSVPVGRLGQPQDIANAVVFLLADRASYITGQSLFVDGGRTFCQ